MENEKRLIDACGLVISTAKNVSWMLSRKGCKPQHIYDGVMRCIAEAPTVDAVEVVHSWWEKSAEGYKICHHCKADVAIFSGHKNYCPNCGAKMDGGNEDGE